MQTPRVVRQTTQTSISRTLGSVEGEVTVRERLAFWVKLLERPARFGSRLSPDDLAKIYAALQRPHPDGHTG